MKEKEIKDIRELFDEWEIGNNELKKELDFIRALISERLPGRYDTDKTVHELVAYIIHDFLHAELVEESLTQANKMLIERDEYIHKEYLAQCKSNGKPNGKKQ